MQSSKHLMIVALALMAIPGVLGAASRVSADPYGFTFTIEDYAIDVQYWYPAHYNIMVENLGTEPDTIEFQLIKELPPSWSAGLCVRGQCTEPPRPLPLVPGAIDSVQLDVWTGGLQDMGLVTLIGTSRGDPGQTASETFATFAGQSTILIVDDDAGADYETYIEAAVDSAGYKARTWDADSLGRPGPVQLSSYWAVLWTTADGDASYLTSSDEQDMMTYLDSGGNLLLASMNLLSSRPGATTFTTDYLHIVSWTNDTGSTVAGGFAGDPVSDGMTLSLMAGPFVPNETDNMVVTSPADSIFRSGIGTNGLKVDESGHKVVFMSFPFEVVIPNAPYPNNQKTLTSRVIDWFEPCIAGTHGIALRDDLAGRLRNSPNPFKGTTRISFVAGRSGIKADLTVYDIQGRAVRHLFRGPAAGGENRIAWDGTDDGGASVAPGMYFYRLTIDGTAIARPMVLLR
jgi:hypothetical protein